MKIIFKNKGKKIAVSIFVCVLMFSLISVSPVYGVDPVGNAGENTVDSVGNAGSDSGCVSGQLCNPLKVNSLGDAVNKGVEIFSYIAILFAVVMIIYVGLKFVMAQGKPDKLKEAGNQLLMIVIGVAIILGARLMISIVINTLEATKVVSPTVIQSAKSVVNQ